MSNNIMANSQIWGQTGTDDASALAGKDRLATDKHTFLKLLVAQLTHQDPLNPTEDKEFVTQLAQFTSLEQLQEINAGVEVLNTTMHQGQMMSATGFIGKDVVVQGEQITKLNNAAGEVLTTQVYFTIDEPMVRGEVNIYDASGQPVYGETLGKYETGTHPFVWDGTNFSGQEVPTGVYKIIISARDKDDKAVVVAQKFPARVTGVMNEDGVYNLVLDVGRMVPLTDVIEVMNADDTVTNVITESGKAANAAAAASIAADKAATSEQKALGAGNTAASAKSHALDAVDAALAAKDAAAVAEVAAGRARENAESQKTSDALKEAELAREWADKAGVAAAAAKTSAGNARTAAEALGATFESEDFGGLFD